MKRLLKEEEKLALSLYTKTTCGCKYGCCLFCDKAVLDHADTYISCSIYEREKTPSGCDVCTEKRKILKEFGIYEELFDE